MEFPRTCTCTKVRSSALADLHTGKLHTTGLFGLAQHINYTGYTLWRTGAALLSGR